MCSPGHWEVSLAGQDPLSSRRVVNPLLLRAMLGTVLCVGHVFPPSPKRMEIFLFSKISFQMCWNFLSVQILENLVLIVKPNGKIQTPFSGIPHPKWMVDFKHFCPQGSSQHYPTERLQQGLAVCYVADWIFILTVL